MLVVILISILCFLNGAALASCFFIAMHRREQNPAVVSEEQKERENYARQFENFLNYRGSGEGQRDYDN